MTNVTIGVTPTKEGTSATFRCSASGTSPITYTWQKVGGVIPNDRWTNHGDGNATLSNIQGTDAGEYTCTAVNEAKQPKTSRLVTLKVFCKFSLIDYTMI